ncbi:Hypothetical predicted protein [Paramuricea clavata]|uniref:Uncharacterized protein n=1 Tax=Paramuricea clavata TaxID=317549 RepID=A0A7D9L6N9_PARCT|nr:Hypothetical predicted protein [Paramuricea clavata]
METQADEATTEPTGQNSPVLNEDNFTNVFEIRQENKPHSDQGSLSEVTECRRSTRETKPKREIENEATISRSGSRSEVYEEAENDQDQIPALPKNKLPSPTMSNNNLNNKVTHDNVTPAPLPVLQNVSAPDKSMNYNAPPFTPPPNSICSAPVQQQILVPGNEQIPHTPTSVPENRHLYDSNKVILEALSLQRLPKLTPKVFEGDEMEFLRWESSFDALVASNTNDSKTMLHYLCKFLKGEPLKMVEHYQDLHHDADTAYCQA